MIFKKLMCVSAIAISSLLASFSLNANAGYYQTLMPTVFLMTEKTNWSWNSIACTMLGKWVGEISFGTAPNYTNLIANTAGQHHLKTDMRENPFRTTWAVRECLSKLRTLKKLPTLNMSIDHYMIKNKKIYHSQHKSSEAYEPKSGVNEKEPLLLWKTAKDIEQEIKNILKEYIIEKGVPCYATMYVKTNVGSIPLLVYGLNASEDGEVKNVLICNDVQAYEISAKEFCKNCQMLSMISPENA